jgi:hypothetical protein
MNINDLREHLNKTDKLKLELKELKKTDSYNISDFLDRFHKSLIWTDFGDRDKFWLPYYYASNNLKVLQDMTQAELNSRFSANKTTLLSILTQHIKGLQRGFREHEEESKSARRD